jgi:TIR domain
MASLFISHGSADRRFVEEELIGLFRALGFESWYAEEDIASAEEWERSIKSGLESSKWFVLVMSRTAASSHWVKAEAAWAVKRRSGTIIPILLDDVTPEEFNILLGPIQYVDYRGGKTKNGRERLISLLINAEYRPQSHAAVLDGVTRCPSKEMLTLVRIVSRGDSQEATIIAPATARSMIC